MARDYIIKKHQPIKDGAPEYFSIEEREYVHMYLIIEIKLDYVVCGLIYKKNAFVWKLLYWKFIENWKL